MDELEEEKRRKALALVTDGQQLATYQNMPGVGLAEEEEAIDLRKYWHILLRHKMTVLLVTIVAVVGAAIYTSMQTPIYRSTVKIQIELQSPQLIGNEGNVSNDIATSILYLQTQFELLKSKKLAKQLVRDLGLTSSSQFGANKKPSFYKDVKSSLNSFFSGNKQQPVEKTQSKAMTESRESALANMLIAGLEADIVNASQIVGISFDNPNPELAARVANGVAESLINMNLKRRFDASSYAKDFLEERTKQVRANLEDSEQKLNAYASDLEIIDFEQKRGSLLEKVKVLNQKLLEVETRRIQAQSVYNQMQVGGSQGFTRILDSPVIQTHKQTMAELESEYEENLRIYKPAYPKMVQLKSNIDELSKKIDQEIENIQTGIRSEFKASVREEAMLKSRISELKKEILDLQSESTEFQVLERDVHTNRELYDGLLQRLKEVDITSGIGYNNISIVDPAEVPATAYKPNLMKNLKMALLLGLFGGIGLAFIFDYLDDTIKSSSDLEKLTGLSVLGIIPQVDTINQEDGTIGLITHEDPTSSHAESYRSLRTALTFSTTSGSPGLLHITSSSAGEGKTTTAISLAITYTQVGSTVLLIDGDMRNPSLHRDLAITNETGLTNYLAGSHKPNQVVQRTQIPKLWVLPTGPIPPNPAELLASGKMIDLVTTAAKKFDMVIIDSPPVLGLADALVLANMAQAVLLVVDAGNTRTRSVENALQRLRQARANVLGTVLTKYGSGSSGYNYDNEYGYSYYGYGKDDDEDEEPRKQLA